jgi:hypothetical protein
VAGGAAEGVGHRGAGQDALGGFHGEVRGGDGDLEAVFAEWHPEVVHVVAGLADDGFRIAVLHAADGEDVGVHFLPGVGDLAPLGPGGFEKAEVFRGVDGGDGGHAVPGGFAGRVAVRQQGGQDVVGAARGVSAFDEAAVAHEVADVVAALEGGVEDLHGRH